MGSNPDVIVVGGGLAGLIACRELLAAGRTCVLLEAQQRVGGRCLTATGPTGALEDLGAEWVQPGVQPLVLRELQRNGLALEAGSEAAEAEGGGAEPPPGAWAPLLQRIDADAQRLPPGQLFTAALQDLDVPWGDYLAAAAAAAGCAPGAAAALAAATFPFSGTPARAVSALAMLREARQFGGARAMLCEREARVQGGTQALARALLARLPPGAARLGCAVQGVAAAPSGAGATVEFLEAGQRQQLAAARGVLLALPFNVLPSLHLQPPLPEGLRQQCLARHAGQCTKTFFTPAAAGSGSEPPAAEESLCYAGRCGQRRAVFCAAGPPPLAALQGGTQALAHDWCADPCSAGTWMAPRPGGQLAALEQLRGLALGGAIRFIGGDLSAHWPGWMEGAVFAGLHNPFLPAVPAAQAAPEAAPAAPETAATVTL